MLTDDQTLILTHDFQGRVLTVDSAMAHLLNRFPAELFGQSLGINLPAEDLLAFKQYLQQMVTGPEMEGLLRIRPRGSKQLRYLHHRSFRVDEPGQFSYITLYARTVTKPALTGQTKLRAEATMQARKNVSATLSHEILTPMNGVLGMANLLTKTPLTDEQQEYVRIICDSGQHLLAVLANALNTNRLSPSPPQLPVKLGGLPDLVLPAEQPLGVAVAATTVAGAPADFDISALRGVRALLVEDNEINRFVACRTMQEWGMEVTEACDGLEGVQLFEQQRFDIVVMDIQMPIMSGIEATVLIRQHSDAARAGIPVLALTANAGQADCERYLAAGMNDCLAKPFEEPVLYAKMLSLLCR